MNARAWMAVVMLVLDVAVADGRQREGPTHSGAVLPGEWGLPVSRAAALDAVEATMKALGLRVEVRMRDAGLIVSRRDTYRAGWPGADALGLAPVHRPSLAEFHAFVPPDFEPARLVIGAVLVSDYVRVPLKLEKAKAVRTMYSHRELGAFFAGEVAKTLGVQLVPLAADASERARQMGGLSPAPASGSCAGRTAVLLPMSSPAVPRLLHEIRPEYPEPELRRGVGGTVVLKAEVTEHGTLREAEWVSGVEDANLVGAAFGAAGLWRFLAARDGGCPARRQVMIEMSFSIRGR